MLPSARLALFGFPSVTSIVHKVVAALFGALSHALLPDFLRNGTVDAIKWLIAVPNPANAALWPNVARLEHDMAALAFGLLGVTFTAAAIRYTLGGAGHAPHPLHALVHTVASAGAITAYHWAFANIVALVNTATHQILSWPVVAQGLGRTVKVLFGGSLLIGSGSVFLAVIALIVIFFAATLFVLKVAVLMLAAILFVSGPVAIALYPLQETARVTRMWLLAALTVVVIPLGWCVIFATAGALSLDVTSFGAVGRQGTAAVIGAKTTGAFAGLLMFAFAAMWPLRVARHLGGHPGAAPVAAGGPGRGGGAVSLGSARVRAAQARLRAGVMAGGAVAGRAAGAAGAPRGGLVGAAGRRAAALRTGPATAAVAGGARRTAPRTGTPVRAAAKRVTGTSAGHSVAQRAHAAAEVLRAGPGQIRAAAAEAVTPSRRERPPRAPEPARAAAAQSTAGNDNRGVNPKPPAKATDPSPPAAEPRAQEGPAPRAPGRRSQAVEGAERRAAPAAAGNPGRELARPPHRRSRKRRSPQPGGEA